MVFEKLKKHFPQIILLFLIAIYFIASPKTEKSIETAFLNPKYENSIDNFCLSYKDEFIRITKRGGIWFGQYQNLAKKTESFFPCDSEIVENFIKNAKKIVRVYEISNNLRAKDRFSLSNNDAFELSFMEADCIVTDLFFGAADSQKRIAFYSASAESKRFQKIFSTDSPILNYLNTSPDFWCDPYIFPKSVCDMGGALAIIEFFDLAIKKDLDSSELARLRHGKIVPTFDFEKGSVLEAAIEVDDGKGNVYRALFAPAGDYEGNYYCRFIANPSAARDSGEKAWLKDLAYTTTISAWTFDKIKGLSK